MLAVALVALLGHDNYRTREAADAALRGMGELAYPALRLALSDESPEVRARAGRMLTPERRKEYRAAVLEWIDGPWPPGDRDLMYLYGNWSLRVSLVRELESRGVKAGSYEYRYLDPRQPPAGCWEVWYAGRSLETARRNFGSPRPWLYPPYPP